MIEDALDQKIYDANDDRVSWLKEHVGRNIRDFISEGRFAENLVNSDGWGIMNHYDGRYEDVDVNGTTYYVMRVN